MKNTSVIKMLGDGSSITKMIQNMRKDFANLSKSINKATDKMNRSMDKFGDHTEKTVKKAKKSMLNFKNAMQLGVTIWGVKNSFEFLSQMEKTNISMDVLKRKNQSLYNVVQRTSQITGGLASKFDMVAAANQGLAFGVIKTGKQFENLMTVMTKLSQINGQEIGKNMNDFIVGVARESKLILDNLLINVNPGQLYDRFAKSIGKTRKELTKLQRMQVLTDEALRQAKKSTKEVTKEMIEKNTQITKSYTLIKEAFTTMGTGIATVLNKIAHRSRMVGEGFAQLFNSRLSAYQKLKALLIDSTAMGEERRKQLDEQNDKMTTATDLLEEQMDGVVRLRKTFKVFGVDTNKTLWKHYLNLDLAGVMLVKNDKRLKAITAQWKKYGQEISVVEAQEIAMAQNIATAWGKMKAQFWTQMKLQYAINQANAKKQAEQDKKNAKKRKDAQKKAWQDRIQLAREWGELHAKATKDLKTKEEFWTDKLNQQKIAKQILFNKKVSMLKLKQMIEEERGRQVIENRNEIEYSKKLKASLEFYKVNKKSETDFATAQDYIRYMNAIKLMAVNLAHDKSKTVEMIKHMTDLKIAKDKISKRDKERLAEETIRHREMLNQQIIDFSNYVKRKGSVVKQLQKDGNYQQAQEQEIQNVINYYNARQGIEENLEEKVQKAIARIIKRYQMQRYEDRLKELLTLKKMGRELEEMTAGIGQDAFSGLMSRQRATEKVRLQEIRNNKDMEIELEKNKVKAQEIIRKKELAGIKLSDKERLKISSETAKRDAQIKKKWSDKNEEMRAREIESLTDMLLRVSGSALQQAGAKIFADGIHRVWIGGGQLVTSGGLKGAETVAYGTAEMAGGLALGYLGTSIIPTVTPSTSVKANGLENKNDRLETQLSHKKQTVKAYLFKDNRKWQQQFDESLKKSGVKK